MRELREAKGLKLYDLAAVVRKDQSMISRYEKGEVAIPIGVGEVFAAYFDVSLDHLYGFDRGSEPQEAAA